MAMRPPSFKLRQTITIKIVPYFIYTRAKWFAYILFTFLEIRLLPLLISSEMSTHEFH